MESPTSKDAMIEFLLILLKEERDKRREVETDLENTKLILNEMANIQRENEKNKYRFLKGQVVCDAGVDEVG